MAMYKLLKSFPYINFVFNTHTFIHSFMLDIALYAVCKQLINCVNMCGHKIVMTKQAKKNVRKTATETERER